MLLLHLLSSHSRHIHGLPVVHGALQAGELAHVLVGPAALEVVPESVHRAWGGHKPQRYTRASLAVPRGRPRGGAVRPTRHRLCPGARRAAVRRHEGARAPRDPGGLRAGTAAARRAPSRVRHVRPQLEQRAAPPHEEGVVQPGAVRADQQVGGARHADVLRERPAAPVVVLVLLLCSGMLAVCAI